MGLQLDSDRELGVQSSCDSIRMERKRRIAGHSCLRLEDEATSWTQVTMTIIRCVNTTRRLRSMRAPSTIRTTTSFKFRHSLTSHGSQTVIWSKCVRHPKTRTPILHLLGPRLGDPETPGDGWTEWSEFRIWVVPTLIIRTRECSSICCWICPQKQPHVPVDECTEKPHTTNRSTVVQSIVCDVLCFETEYRRPALSTRGQAYQ